MIGGLKPYPEYRESGLPWLGRIPAHWEVRRNGRLFSQRNETGFGELPILEVSLKTGVRVRNLGDGKRKQIMADHAKYKRAVRGDIAYNMMRLWQGAVGVAPVDGLVSPAYVVANPLPGVDSRYYAYLFRVGAYMEEVNKYSHGIVTDRNRLYWDEFKQMPSVFPPPEEQTAVVNFLEHQAALVNRLVRTKRRLIELLNEQRQIMIHGLVTRGVDRSPRLKPSGILWLGDIPEHWEVVSVGVACSLIQTGPFGSQLHSSEYTFDGTPVINPSHMRDGRIAPDKHITITPTKAKALQRHRVQPGDILVARRGELGRCALVTDAENGWVCGTGSLLARCSPAMLTPAYFQQVFSSNGVRDALGLASIGATMENLNAGMVARLYVPRPPLPEQYRIVAQVETAMQSCAVAVSNVQRDIDLLREYRTRLVADVVTGKLDTREAAISLPVDVDEAEAIIAPEEEDEREELLEAVADDA